MAMASLRERVDLESDVTRGVVTGCAFLVGLALNLDPERFWLAVGVFGGGAVAFFGLAVLASRDDEYRNPKLRWQLFGAWGVLLCGIAYSTESTFGFLLGGLVAVYAAVRAWLFDALADDASADGPTDEGWTGDALPPHRRPDDGDEGSE